MSCPYAFCNFQQVVIRGKTKEFGQHQSERFPSFSNWIFFVGAAHWELICRARSVDNQVYCGVISPARDESADYVAWGHSTLVNPWGDIVAKAGHQEEIIYADIEMSKLQEIRKQIPITVQRRFDLYETICKK